MNNNDKKPAVSGMATRYFQFLVVLLAMFWVAQPLSAEDLQGSKDSPFLKRFAGSEIVGYQKKSLAEYELQTSTFVRYNLETRKREFVQPPLKPEGRLTSIWYESAGDTSALELYKSFLNDLLSKGFVLLYDSRRDSAATKWKNYLAPFAKPGVTTSRSSDVFYSAEESSLCVATAKKKRPEGDVYVSLVVVEWNKEDRIAKAKRGAYAAVDIIESARPAPTAAPQSAVKPVAEVKPVVQHPKPQSATPQPATHPVAEVKPVQQPRKESMVTGADEMAQAIASHGKVVVYGIAFDTNRAEIKPSSKAVLAEIAKLMNKKPSLKLQVVGHTDNVGGNEFNLALSKRRAAAVVAVLRKEYAIAASRLSAEGSGALAPVATNATDAGRAKNRRVELVAQ